MSRNKKKKKRFRFFEDLSPNYDREVFRNRGGFREAFGVETASDQYYKDHFSQVLILATGLGLFTGFLVWIFFLTFSIGKSFLWPKEIPFGLSLNTYRTLLLFCGAGLVGLIQNRWPGYPKGLHNVITSIRKEGSFGFDHIPAVVLATMVPLIFGSAVGPEASLMSFIATVMCYVAKRVHASHLQSQIAGYVGICAGLGACFLAPLFGFTEIIEQPISLKDDDTIIFPRTKRLILYFTAILFAMLSVSILNHLIPAVSGVPHFPGNGVVKTPEIVLFLPLVLLSALTASLFRFFNYMNEKLLKPIRSRPIVKALFAAAVMSLVMAYLPLTQFTGEPEIELLMRAYRTYTPAILFLTVLFKMYLVSLCVISGWRGGNLYPTVFTGVCFGYACALLFPQADVIFLVCTAAASFCGSILRKPMACAMLLLLCFPVGLIPWMFAASFISSLIPLFFERYFNFF